MENINIGEFKEDVMNELISIKKEMSEYNKHIKDLRKREKEIKIKISEYLTDNNEEKLSTDECSVKLIKKKKDIIRKKEDQEEHVKKILYENGMDDDVVDSVLNKKIDTINHQILQIKLL